MSTLLLGKDEKVVREEPEVHYHGGYSRIGYYMWGKLILTNKRFAFLHQQTVESGPFFAKKREVQTVGIKINLPIDKVIGASVETRTRKKGTLSDPPTLFSKEQYRVLTVSLDTPEGMENPAFEVSEPDMWVRVIQRVIGGEVM